jgi:diguanylate cyclase (GGDEF)-like protein
VLTEVAERLQENLRQYDIVARLGGESFGILFPETELSDAVLVTERCREAVLAMSLPLESTGATLGVSISAGVACNGTGPTSKLESLMQAAGAALCRVKEGTGNRVEAEGAED